METRKKIPFKRSEKIVFEATFKFRKITATRTATTEAELFSLVNTTLENSDYSLISMEKVIVDQIEPCVGLNNLANVTFE